MILRDLYLYADLVEFNGHSALTPFRGQTRSLCHFVGSRVAREKFRAPFGRICVIGASAPGDACSVNSCNVLGVEVPFTAADFAHLDDAQPNDYFIGLLEHGLAKAAAQHALPLAAYTQAIADFRAGGYRNEWVWQKKMPRGLGLTLSFDCSLTRRSFEMKLRVFRKEALLLDELIFETTPDEICFVPLFKKLAVEGHTVAVLDRFDRPTYSRDLSDLLR